MQLYLLYLPTYMYVYNNCGVVLTSVQNESDQKYWNTTVTVTL